MEAAAEANQGGDDPGQSRRQSPRATLSSSITPAPRVPGIPIPPRRLEEASAALENLREGKLVGRAVLTLQSERRELGWPLHQGRPKLPIDLTLTGNACKLGVDGLAPLSTMVAASWETIPHL